MQTVVLLSSRRGLSRLVRRITGSAVKCLVVRFSRESSYSDGVYQESKIVQLSRAELASIDSQRFLEEYVRTVGMIGANCDSKLWWATDIASKNRFASRLPTLLDQLQLCMVATRRDFDLLVVYKPDLLVAQALRRLVGDQFQMIPSHGTKLKLWCWTFCSALGRILQLFKELLFTIHRIVVFRASLARVDVPNEVDYLVKTFTYDSSFDGKDQHVDAFFGILPNFLAKHGRVLTVTNILGGYQNCLARLRRGQNTEVVPLEKYLTIRAAVRGFLVILTSRLVIKGAVSFLGLDVGKLIAQELSRTRMGISLYQYLHYEVFKKLVDKTRVRCCILTYENNPWEKMSIRGLRETSPGTRIVGYQHSVVPQSAANLYCGMYEGQHMPLPDKVLTVGDEPKAIIERYSQCNTLDIQSCCGLRFQYLGMLKRKPRQKSGRILVALEGVPEVLSMLRYVLEEIGQASDYCFRIRFHPALPFHRMRRYIRGDLLLAGSMHVSSGTSLAEDLQWSEICIYWGSTVALEALAMGIALIHYDDEQPWSYDPLFMCSDLKWTVTQRIPLLPVVKGIYAMNDQEYEIQATRGKEYVDRYFLPVSEREMAKFIRD